MSLFSLPLPFALCTHDLFGLDLHTLHLPICLASVDLLSSLRNRLENSLVLQSGLGDDGSGLGFERDFVGFDACALLAYILNIISQDRRE